MMDKEKEEQTEDRLRAHFLGMSLQKFLERKSELEHQAEFICQDATASSIGFHV